MIKCLTIILGGVLLLPVCVMSADLAGFDQFADVSNVGLLQGASVSSDLGLESDADANMVQGANIISGYHFPGTVLQAALVAGDLSMNVISGDNVFQAVNVYRGSADEIYQIAVIDGTARISSQGSERGMQGINVITNCDACSN